MPHAIYDEHLWLVVRRCIIWSPPTLLRYLELVNLGHNCLICRELGHYILWAKQLCVLRTTCTTTHHDWRRLHHFIWVVRLEHGRAAKAAETYRSSLWLKGHSWQLIQDAHESVVQSYNGGTWTEAFAAEGSWLRPGYESGTSEDIE